MQKKQLLHAARDVDMCHSKRGNPRILRRMSFLHDRTITRYKRHAKHKKCKLELTPYEQILKERREYYWEEGAGIRDVPNKTWRKPVRCLRYRCTTYLQQTISWTLLVYALQSICLRRRSLWRARCNWPKSLSGALYKQDLLVNVFGTSRTSVHRGHQGGHIYSKERAQKARAWKGEVRVCVTIVLSLPVVGKGKFWNRFSHGNHVNSRSLQRPSAFGLFGTASANLDWHGNRLHKDLTKIVL